MLAQDRRRLTRNLIAVQALGFFQVFLIIVPVVVPLFQSRGLSMTEVFQLQALFSAVMLICEVPAGYAADLLGRRGVLVAGAAFVGLGHSQLPGAQGFWGLAGFEVCLGIAASLISGADLAMLLDTEAALGRPATGQQRSIGRLFSLHTVGEALAALVCSGLMLISMDAVIQAQVITGWLPLVCACLLHEPPRQSISVARTRAQHRENFSVLLRLLLVDNAVLRLTFLCLGLWSVSTYLAVWTIQKYWGLGGLDLYWFGIIWGAFLGMSALSGHFADRVEGRCGPAAVLLMAGLAPAACFAGMLSGTLWLGVVGGVLLFAGRGLGVVVLRHALNSRVPAGYRATANSLVSFLFRIGAVLTGPPAGYALDRWGMQWTLLALIGLSLLLFAGLMLPLIFAVASARRSAVKAVQAGAA